MSMAYLIRSLILMALIVSGCAGGNSYKAGEAGSEAELNLAVVREFSGTAKKMAKDFYKRTGMPVEITVGTPEELIYKIKLGMEYDVLMAADTEHPEMLVSEGLAGQETVYALGTIALYSTYWKLNRPEAGRIYIWSERYKTLAVTDPEKSLYGRAAAEILNSEYGLSERVGDRLVYGDDVESTLELVESKQADAGLVAYPDLSEEDQRWVWLIPESAYDPIEQGAVVLTRAKDKKAAQVWMEYISSAAGKAALRRAGYRIPGEDAETQKTAANVPLQ
jgi:molybdate transport system substrate-binding protein